MTKAVRPKRVRRSFKHPLTCLALLLSQVWLPVMASQTIVDVANREAVRSATPQLMLAKLWPVNQDPSGYLVSEKLDGVRAFWDGHHLRFRSGVPIAAPAWFTAALPQTALDGELWLGRGQFDRLSGIVRRMAPVDADWRDVRYMVFDLPGAPEAFAQRVQRIQDVVRAAGQTWLQAVPQRQVHSAHDLKRQLEALARSGGEGWVLHRASALWLPGRSDALYKFKPKADEDAVVVAHLPGKGRNAGRLGALLLEMPDGQRFALGSGFSDAQRDAPPAVGSVVTYRYADRTPKGIPRFATFWRVRGGE